MIRFRSATPADAPEIVAMIRELAEYEKLADQAIVTEEVLRENLFGMRPYAEVLLAESNGKLTAFCLFFHNFSTFLGKPGLYVEDLYVRPAFRNQGIGKRFFVELARIAQERGCGRIEWWVLDWNTPAIEFYRRLGAEAMSEWTVYRLSQRAIETLEGEALCAEHA